MRDAERICNLSVYVAQSRHRVVEVMTYDTESQILNVNHTALNSIVWNGNAPRMPASGGYGYGCMYIIFCCSADRT